MNAILKRMGMVGACIYACAAGDAASRGIADFRTEQAPFRVMAPEATQRASFQENGCPDAGAVMDGKTLNIEDETAVLHL